MISERSAQFKRFTSVAVETVKNAPVGIAGVELPLGAEVPLHRIDFTRPVISATHSLVLMVTVTGLNESDVVAEFVVRKEEKEALEARKQAASDPNLRALHAEYLPTVYLRDRKTKWTAVERLKGLESESLKDAFEDEKFCAMYAQNGVRLLLATNGAGYTLADLNLSTGHNVMVDPSTAQIKIIEPDMFIPIWRTHTKTEDLANRVLQELSYGSDTLYRNTEGEEYYKDNRHIRRFLYPLLLEMSRHIDLQSLMRPERTSHYFSYLKEKRPDFVQIFPVERRKMRRDFYAENIFVERLSPSLIAAIVAGDFNSFDEVVKSEQGYRVIEVSPRGVYASELPSPES